MTDKQLYKKGYKKGVEDALAVFKSIQAENDFKIQDSEFYLLLEELFNEVL